MVGATMNETLTGRTPLSCVTVVAPARLHMGFMDLNGGLGRSFGGIGLAISGLATAVQVETAEMSGIDGPKAELERVMKILGQLSRRDSNVAEKIRITVTQSIPPHAGLGSGTQMALAVGSGIARLNRWDLTTRDIAALTKRGARSGIGIGAFDAGGFIVDGGRGQKGTPPDVISRLAFPEEWRVLLVFGGDHQGVHGANEAAAFLALPTFPEDMAAHLCRLVMMQMLPALAERNVKEFGGAISRLQEVIGGYFAPQQGGRYANSTVAAILDWLENEGAAGVGQSSWGPTGFAIYGSEKEATEAMSHAVTKWPDSSVASFMICSGLNHGATITESVTGNKGIHHHLMACVS